jgi:hypothetical protein
MKTNSSSDIFCVEYFITPSAYKISSQFVSN